MERKCVQLADIDSGVSCADYDNLAGVVDEIIYGYWDDVDSWPSLPEGTENSPLTLANAGKWNGDVVMKTGSRAYKLKFTEGTGVLTMTDQGERGGESVLYQLDLVRSKITDVILGFMNATRGRKMFFVVTDKNGVKYLMGDQLTGARRVAGDAVTTGTASTDRNGVPLRFTYDCPRNLVFEGECVSEFEVLDALPFHLTSSNEFRIKAPYGFPIQRMKDLEIETDGDVMVGRYVSGGAQMGHVIFDADRSGLYSFKCVLSPESTRENYFFSITLETGDPTNITGIVAWP